MDIIQGEQRYQLIKLTLDSGESIETTAEHPFYIKGKGWNPACSLKVGEALQLHNGTTVVIMQIETGTRVEKVYNLTVANTHNYFVGEDGVLVHNCRPKDFPNDFASKNTRNYSAKYQSEREARNLARTKLGKNPVQVGPNKLRSQDGKWQYRGKPEDLAGHGPNDSPHIHLERLNPKTGEVLDNWHLRW